ncbi:MAG: Fibronectin type domain protein [Bacteroidetes bacterium]|nr:Fibronectin type domain protein [Bacteroidota bacterium]
MCISKMMFRTIFVGMLVIASIESTFADATVSVSPATKNVLPTSGNFVLSVNIANAVGVHAFHVVFNINNAVIRYVGRLEGTFLNGGGTFSTFFSSNPPASPTVTSVTVDCAILGPPSDVVSGDGTLFTITFAPVANGVSAVTLSEVELRDGNNATLPVTPPLSGSVTVTNPLQTFVDPDYNSGNAGGHEFGFDAFNTLASGVDAVSTGGTVIIAPAVYNETVTLSRNVTLTPASGTPALQNLTLNTAAASLGGNLQVNGALTLATGVLSTGANRVIISSSAPGAVVVTSGSINGEIQRAIAALSTGSYMFTDLNTQLIPNGLQGAITATIRSFPNTPPPNVGTGTAINRYYSITPSGPLTAAVRLAYLDTEINGINEFNMTLFRYTGVAWASYASVPQPVDNYVESPIVSEFSNWTIGDENDPLPIQLASFTGTVSSNGNVVLTWVTLSELNNYGFFVQRKRPNEQAYFEIPGSFVPGHGTTNEQQTYSFTDVAPGAGLWQYRLKQVDLDNDVHYTEPILIDVVTDVRGRNTPLAFALAQNFPNPFNPTTTIEFALPKAGYTTLKVFNLLGQEVGSLVDGLVDAGRHTITWNASTLPSSVYLYKLTSNGSVETKRLVLMR